MPLNQDRFKAAIADLQSELGQAAPGMVKIGSHNQIVIITDSQVSLGASYGTISESQMAELHEIVDRIVHANAGYTFPRIWKSLSRYMGVGSSRAIPADRFYLARRYLANWAKKVEGK
jgi:hypothetical protein